MGNGDTTRTHRAVERVKTSSGSERAWGVWQGVLVVGICALAGGFLTMRDDVIVATAFAQTEAPAVHEKMDDRLAHLERPELAIKLAQATGALHKVEAAAELAHENAAAIGVIQNDLEHVKTGGDRRERMLERVLLKLDSLNVRSQ